MSTTANKPVRSSRIGNESEELGAAVDARDAAWAVVVARRNELRAAETAYNRTTFNAALLKYKLVEGACYTENGRVGIVQFRDDPIHTIQLRLITKAGKPGSTLIVRYAEHLTAAVLPDEAKDAPGVIAAEEYKPLFSKYYGTEVLSKTTVDDIPSRQLYEYWNSKGTPQKWDTMTPEECTQVHGHWVSVQRGYGRE